MVLIDALSAIVLLGVWFFYFARYNRREGATALHWVEAACSSKGHMLDARWLGVSPAARPLRLLRALVRQRPG